MHLTFVFPCLNEERFIENCIRQVQASLNQDPQLQYEIVVGDNGSTDRSREIAEACGARVVPVPERGYGAALRGGIAAAKGQYVMFADADGTYYYENALELYHMSQRSGADMGIASRLKGTIEKGAMPFLHRWLGTPVLTSLINLLFQGKLSDCNSGFRCLKKKAYETWGIRASGMEFASELLIKALKHEAHCVEIPSGLRPSPIERTPHLRTWRDGMRHLLFILSEHPRSFELVGIVILALTSVLQLIAITMGPSQILGFNVFDIHSQLLVLLLAIIGAQVYLFSCMLYLQSGDSPYAFTKTLIEMDEGVLFFLLLGLFAGILTMISWITWQWAQRDFSNLHYGNSLIGWSHLLAIPATGIIGLLGIHVLRKAK